MVSSTSFTVSVEDADGRNVRLSGRLQLRDADALRAAVRGAVAGAPAPRRVDLGALDALDGAGAATLLALRDEHQLELTGASEHVQRLLDLYAVGPATAAPAEFDRGFLDELGRTTAEQLDVLRRVLGFVGELTVGAIGASRRPRSVHWREVVPLMERAGADGVPIVLLINFLVGLIMGYQAAIQLQRFGADVFIADLVGLSITRELGPLMTAIIVAGRSGAAYAAELGTMRVREEIDALQTLGLDPVRFLVFPRVVALAVVVPLLTLLADFVGCVGGLVVAVGILDLTMVGYLNELQKAVDLWDVFGGVFKSFVFAVTITMISCQRGLATRGGAAAVGASTTSAVVIILFSLVTLDAAFAVVFNALGI